MIVLLGKSGSGKSTIEKQLIDHNYKKIISYTSRTKRANEIDGVDYHFISKEKFENLACNDFFGTNICFDGNYYGAAKNDFTKESVIVIGKEALPQINNLKDICSTCFYINVTTPTRFRRMSKRGDSFVKIIKRLSHDHKAFKEVESQVDHVINNNNGYNGIEEILRIIKRDA